MGTVTIEDLPDPIIEYIFSYLSPYRDLKQCMLVNKAWYKHVSDVVRKTQRDLKNAIVSMSVHWSRMVCEPGPTISKRYSHSACCSGESMYVFGGCTTENTTFNDLWRLDLGTRNWVRPLATGTYPPPKACATLVPYEEKLILFGGWTHTSPLPVYPVWRIFSHLHIYNTSTNKWAQISTHSSSPSLAGHSATMHGDQMVVFGGIQRQREGSLASRHSSYNNSNAVWSLNMKSLTWRRCTTTRDMPLPRYGHSQIAIDDHHLIIMGGCGGPNMLFNDIWLLEIKDDPFEPWVWRAMEIRQKENAAPHLAFHPACRVGNSVVVMSKTQRSQMSPSSLPHPLRAPSRSRAHAAAHPNESADGRLSSNHRVDVEHCVNGKKGVLKRQFERHQPHSSNRTSSSDEDDLHSPDFAKKIASSSAKHISPPRNDAFGNQAGPSRNGDFGNQAGPSRNSDFGNQAGPSRNSDFGNQAGPSRNGAFANQPGPSHMNNNASGVRYPIISGSYVPLPKALTFTPVDHISCVPSAPCKAFGNLNPNPEQDEFDSNELRALVYMRPNSRRNRQRQLEGLDRMERRLRELRAGALRRANSAPGGKPRASSLSVASRNAMCLYVLDISTAISDGYVTWRKIVNQSSYAPDGIILYSFVLGRGELIMFGGIQKDLNCKWQEGESIPEVVSNALHFMSAHKYII